MPFDLAAHLREGMRNVHWHVSDLWVASVGIGGYMGNSDVEAITCATVRSQHTLLRCARSHMGMSQPCTHVIDCPVE